MISYAVKVKTHQKRSFPPRREKEITTYFPFTHQGLDGIYKLKANIFGFVYFSLKYFIVAPLHSKKKLG